MTEKESTILQAFIEAMRPPEHIRPQLDIGFSYEKQCIELFEIRPNWRDKTIIQHLPFARIRYLGTQNVWKLYWHRANGKWVSYSPYPESPDLDLLLKEVDEDGYGCFKG
ncbi:MAG: DUF3024 domain-containing protein [Chitinophagales bacterium]|nr:DUF3024 domain-containing protein [Chitinophagales bacterium]